MTTVWLPHAKVSKAGKLFLEALKKFPNDRTLAKNLLNNAIVATKEGYKVVIADEIKDGKLKELIHFMLKNGNRDIFIINRNFNQIHESIFQLYNP